MSKNKREERQRNVTRQVIGDLKGWRREKQSSAKIEALELTKRVFDQIPSGHFAMGLKKKVGNTRKVAH